MATLISGNGLKRDRGCVVDRSAAVRGAVA
jgi:hypothetical protein